MGGSPSRPRRLTVDNDEPTSVIKVSEDVVQRLKNAETVQMPSLSHTAGLPGSGVAPVSIPPQQFIYHPTYTSLQIQQAKEAALKENDVYWEQRVTNLEKVHGQMHQIMEAEYHRAVDEQTKEPATVAIACKSPPCQKRKNAVLECYKTYPREPMKCSKEVEAFAECVDVQRANIVANRG